MKRLEAVACDAELQEKPLADLRKLGTYLREQCVSVMNDMKNTDQAQGDEGKIILYVLQIAKFFFFFSSTFSVNVFNFQPVTKEKIEGLLSKLEVLL